MYIILIYYTSNKEEKGMFKFRCFKPSYRVTTNDPAYTIHNMHTNIFFIFYSHHSHYKSMFKFYFFLPTNK